MCIRDRYRVTPNGEDYYRNNRQEFIFEIPVMGYVWSDTAEKEVVAFRKYINITDPQMQAALASLDVEHQLYGLFGAGMVRDRLSGPAQVQAAITEAVHLYIERLDTDDIEGHKIILHASDVTYCYDDTRPIRYSEQIVRHIRDDGTPVIENILDRPLQGFPAMPANMYQKLGLCEIAMHDLKDKGGCMVAQIYECAKKRVNGKRTGNGTREQKTHEKVFKDHEEIEKAFDEIFAELYPGEPVDPEEEELDDKPTIVRPVPGPRPEVRKRAYPYEFDGWREEGVNTYMVDRLGQLKKMAVRVVRDRAIIHSFDPVSKEHTRANTLPVLVYNVWGDHAFFYDNHEAKQGAAMLMKKAPFITTKQPTMSLKVDERFKEDSELYSDMEAFPWNDRSKFDRKFLDLEEDKDGGKIEEVPYVRFKVLKEQIASNEPKTFYTFASEIDMVKDALENDPEIPGFYTRLGMDPSHISAIIFTEKKQKTKSKSQKIKIKIRVVPDDAEALQVFASEFEKKTNLRLPYRGESEAVLMNRAVMEIMVYKRRFVPPAVREAVNKRCKGHCALCGDAYGTKFDVDHTIPLREGGLDDESNMQALCRPCHAKKCEQEEVTCTTRLNTLASELSPEMLNMLHYAVKPKQVYWGGPKPKAAKVTAIDAVGCRVNAIVDSVDPLPVFCPLDAPELCHNEHGLLKRDPMYYDYIYVDVPEGDNRDRFPYTGRRFYWKGSVRYMLDTGKIDKGHLKAGVRATNHVSPNALNEAFKTIKELYIHVVYLKKSWECIAEDEVNPKDIVQGQKGAVLACIGLWNSNDQCIWKKVKSAYESDAGGPVKRRKELDEGIFEFAWSVDLVGLRSMRPIGEIALQMEQVRIAEILDIMRPYEIRKEIVRLGAVVDCVYFDAKPFFNLQVDVDQARLPSGAPKFQIKLEDAKKSPVNWTKSPSILHQEANFDPVDWKHFTDPTLEEMIQILMERHGALVTGPAGVGKTWTMRQVLKRLKRMMKKEGRQLINLNCAIRHAAARLIGGSTIAHLLNKYRRQGGPKFAKDCVILIDEASEIPLSMWTELAQWYLLGVRFVIIGDFDGQFLPMFDRWGKALESNDIQTSQFFHSLCEGTRVHFTQYRRGDESARPLFDFYCSLYPDLKLENQMAALDRALDKAMAFFLPCEIGTMPDVILTNSHYKRRLLNHAVNLWRVERLDKPSLFIPCTKSKALGVTMLPQDMTIWVGMELLGCIHQSNSKTVINLSLIHI